VLRSLEEAEAVATASDTMETPPSVQCEHIAIACLCTLLTSATSANHLAGPVVRGTAAVANSAQVVSGESRDTSQERRWDCCAHEEKKGLESVNTLFTCHQAAADSYK